MKLGIFNGRAGICDSEGIIYWLPKGIKILDMIKSKLSFELALLEQGPHLSQVKFYPPILQPSKIVCIGRNYKAHAKELGNIVPSEPLIFLKPPSCLIGHQEKVILPVISERVDHESELAVIIGHKIEKATLKESDQHWRSWIFGYTCFFDITARDIQRKDKTWTRGKGFDTFGPIGPYITTTDEIKDPHSLNITCTVDDEIRQNGNTRDLIFNIPTLISYVSNIMTLFPGDILATGTPAGVGAIIKNNVVKMNIEEIGQLQITVA